MDTVLTAILLVLSVLIFYFYNDKRKKKSNLPGPNGYPFLGNTLDVDFENLHLKLFEWGKTFGDIFQINLFGKTFVVVNSSKVLRELFSKEPNATLTSARPDTFARNYMLSDVDVAFTSLDKKWNQRRKLMHKLLHAYGEGLQYIEAEITNKLTGIRREFLEKNQQSSNPENLVDDFVLSVLEILLVGKNDEPGSEFHKYIIDLNESGNAVANPGVDTLYYNLPFLRFLPLPATKNYRRFITLRDGLIEFLEKKSGNSDVGIFPTMKRLLSEKGNNQNEQWFTYTIMQSMLLNMVGADYIYGIAYINGKDGPTEINVFATLICCGMTQIHDKSCPMKAYLTTKGTLISMIRILMTLPDVQVKLQQEVDRVVGHDRQSLINDRYDMPYHEAVILETLRFISHVPSSLLHSVSQDTSYGKYRIPKDASILTNLWAMHHSKDEWENPFKFEPERFLDENGEILPADHEIRKRFMAFGLGKRSCIGEAFAKSRIFLFLSTLMQVCTVLPPDGEKLPMLDPRNMTSGIAIFPHPFKCRYVQREV